MIAMILAAGQGTRLRPLTDSKPKALVEVQGVALLEIALRRLISAGFNKVIVNVHHLSSQIADFLESNGNFGIEILISDESRRLLDTGGAIKKASGWFRGEGHVLVHNIDILTDFDLDPLVSAHKESGALATLVVKDRPTSRNLLIDKTGRLCGWEYPEKRISILTKDNKKGLSVKAFSAIYLFSEQLTGLFPEEEVFGLMPWLLDLAQDHSIMTWDQGDSGWFEVGRTDSLETAGRILHIDRQTGKVSVKR